MHTVCRDVHAMGQHQPVPTRRAVRVCVWGVYGLPLVLANVSSYACLRAGEFKYQYCTTGCPHWLCSLAALTGCPHSSVYRGGSCWCVGVVV
jgi:hypothetical protein